MKIINLLGPLGLVLVVVAARNDAGPAFERLALSEGVYTEGASFGDVNGDGKIDLLAGPLWWEGPDFKKSHRYRPGESVPAEGYAHNSFQSWVRDMDGDGRADVFQVDHDGNFHLDLYLQPAEPSEDWPRHRVVTKMGNESPELADLKGDGNPVLLAMQEGKIGYFSPDWNEPQKPWRFQPISEKRADSAYYHGLGFGDLNGDGRVDILEKGGWYEGPEGPHFSGNWTFHPYLFSMKGGAQMLVYDVDGDGDNDVVTSLAAHAWGLAWFENDDLSFTRHELIPEEKKPGVGGVVFTQAHALVTGDFNGDGLTDFATGKRYFAHNGNDPDSTGSAVLYWYELERKDGHAEFVPHLIDSDSGAGTQLAAADVNGDGKTDLGIGNKKGVFVFKSR